MRSGFYGFPARENAALIRQEAIQAPLRCDSASGLLDTILRVTPDGYRFRRCPILDRRDLLAPGQATSMRPSTHGRAIVPDPSDAYVVSYAEIQRAVKGGGFSPERPKSR